MCAVTVKNFNEILSDERCNHRSIELTKAWNRNVHEPAEHQGHLLSGVRQHSSSQV